MHTLPSYKFSFRLFIFFLIWAGAQVPGDGELAAATRRYRASWRADPATSMVIGFEHYRGSSVKLVYDLQDHGTEVSRYRFSATPARTVNSHGMRNCFVRLTQLRAGTTYYFLVVDSEGASQRMSFETPPNSPDVPLSIIAGGDSRNNRGVTQQANRLVSKLRPHFVLFGGDMTNSDTDGEWQTWFDDWQLTISADGRLTPIVPARGNHERDNSTIEELFDVANPQIYYELTFGGNLLSTYTLNTLFPAGGQQQEWLRGTLSRSRSRWKIAQYHQSMRPHTSYKPERDELIYFWASLFQEFGMNLVVESDVHVVKQTYPIRPSGQAGSAEGFIRDDDNGTVYTGEGCWGAPLRNNDDDKSWTRASGRFNQFKWIWVSKNDMQVRTVMIDRSSGVQSEVSPNARFNTPAGIYYWDAPNGGDVLTISPRKRSNQTAGAPTPPRPALVQSTNATGPAVVHITNGNQVAVPFTLADNDRPSILIAAGEGKTLRILQRFELAVRGPGPYTETINLPSLPRGEKLEVVVKGSSGVIVKYDLQQ